MITVPPSLRPGDTIGLVAPAGFMAFEKMEACINTLQDWGFNVKLGATTQSVSANYFSANDEERLFDLQTMLDDPEVRAVMCARGGYGMSRIVEQISFKKLKKKPKWIIGFSDITVLHAHLYSRHKMASLHAPMAAAFNDNECNNPYVLSLKDALIGVPAIYETAPHMYNRPGEAEGELVGGNLSLLAHLTGTRSDIKTKNKILFLEDIGEYIYNIDRMFIQFERAGKFKKLAALVIGGFTDSKDTERPFGMDAYEVIYEKTNQFDFPVCFDFPVSHNKENYALKIGVQYRLNIDHHKVVLAESVDS